ncbi:50S ribosomal protein L6 [Candidatus Micrarchaeota archaeon]|nr:50S ribosomal protein L6 [Candidatus Micrarchaeota archaeon]
MNPKAGEGEIMQIPEGVLLQFDNLKLHAKGPKGELSRPFPQTVQIKIEGKELSVLATSKALENTSYAHVRNMIKGVTEGYKTTMKMVFAHFPMTVEVKGKDITIKNFLGEKQPRRAKIFGNVKIEVKGQDVILTSSDKEELGQTVANIRTATKIRNKDGRVFQDGIYVIS